MVTLLVLVALGLGVAAVVFIGADFWLHEHDSRDTQFSLLHHARCD